MTPLLSFVIGGHPTGPRLLPRFYCTLSKAIRSLSTGGLEPGNMMRLGSAFFYGKYQKNGFRRGNALILPGVPILFVAS